ncbi:WD40 repeat-like protein [Leucogyrophana mollusca]|uniref:WD40 repeat-like protein n=1 Tax=Leucogyrophana mollusca TaxID=85980 RepID=A0ACB8B155_9AGAM|nr:WD40 repeat-like protein [Leucogyrophana mollusca]
MLFTPYSPIQTLRGHVDSVTCLAFSPNGDRLASGGDDGNVIIWEPENGKMLYRIVIASAVTSLVWDPEESTSRLFVGCGDGTLAVLHNFEAQEPSNQILTGAKASVHTIAVDALTGHVAIGLGSEVHIAKEIAPKKFATFKILPSPSELPKTSKNADLRIRARSLAFMTKGSRLVVSYLNHGVVCWDIEGLMQLWCIVPIHSHRLIGHAALSPDEKDVLISNLCEGMDLYAIGCSKPTKLFKCTPNADNNVPVQVSFLHGGQAAICGSAVGSVNIWSIESGECFQSLDHGGEYLSYAA